MTNLSMYPHANEVRQSAKEMRENNASLLTIWKSIWGKKSVRIYGDYVLSWNIIKGCLDFGKIKKSEFWDLVRLFKKNEDETYPAILENLGEECGFTKQAVESKVEDYFSNNIDTAKTAELAT